MWKFLSRPDRSGDASAVPGDRGAITPQMLEAVRRIEIRARRLVDETFSGEYHSVFKGRGIEFREVREYVPGDDVRSIDWNVTARADAPHVKQFDEERELTVMLAVDVSRSGRFGSGDQTRLEIAAELCGVLALSATSNRDKVGLVLFSDRVELYIPPARGRGHVLRIIRELLAAEAEGVGTEIAAPLELLGSVLKRKTTIFLVSDFWAEGFERPLQVVARRHDMVAVRVRDPRETDPGGAGLVRWIDAETGREQLVDTSRSEVREALKSNAEAYDRGLTDLFRRSRMDVIDIDTTRSYVDPLRRFFMRRVRRAGRRL
ncbi:DUF58 domain-containing protein [bacterium]|nr:DUF58 domain-containing protein [bacterium]